MRRTRAHVLELHIKRYGWRRLVELGVHKGDTMRSLLTSCRRVEYVGVDTWTEGAPEHEATPPPLKKSLSDDGSRHYPRQHFNEQRARAIERAHRDRAVLLKMTTAEAAELIDDGSVDCVFVDADHRPDAVEADIRTWLPKITENGWIFGHDYNLPVLGQRVKALLPSIRLFDDNVWGLPAAAARAELAQASQAVTPQPAKRRAGRPRKMAA